MLPEPLIQIQNKRLAHFDELSAQYPALAVEHAQLKQEFARTITLSDYVNDSLNHFPFMAETLLKPECVHQPLDNEALNSQLQKAIDGCDKEETLFTALRQFRRLQQMRLIWRDANKRSDLRGTLEEITLVADAFIRQTLDWQHARLAKRYGEPIGKCSGEPLKMIVIAMGKQGARELNLSSDIDLIFAFHENGDTNAGDDQKSISNQEFFTKLGQALIQSLDKITADGFVYRVDMRLRPYGQSGPLAMNFSSLENYYHDQGREWERYAMIKARPVTGDQHHIDELMRILRPFSYRKYVDFGVFESLRDMKSRIQQETLRRNLGNNVKLGSGGIREIEFIAQAFQLIRGGQERELQQPNIFIVFDYLKNNEYLPFEAIKDLLSAYEFLRDAEHAIQALKDEQSQTLPDDELNQSRIANYLNYKDWNEFSDLLEHHRKNVTHHFQQIVAQDDDHEEDDDINLWRSIWLNVCELCDVPANSESVQTTLQRLRDQANTKMQDIGRQRLDKTMPLLLKALWQSEQPEAALERLVPLIEAILRRSAYFVLLSENPQVLQQLVRLCEASPWIAQNIADNPILLDELLHPAHLFNPNDKAAMAEDLEQRLLRIHEDDLEDQMDALRHFANAQKLQIAACEITGVLPLMKVSDHLTWLAETVLTKSLELAWFQMVQKYGYPSDKNKEPVLLPEMIILGYGKLGGIELSYNSDLDMVFLHKGHPNGYTNGPRELENGVFYTRLGQRLIHILNTNTRAGQLYEADMRLRPSGSSGMIVASLAGFEKYQQEEAWTWEHQALLRARVILAGSGLGEEFGQIRRLILSKQQNPHQLQQEVREMRQKMRDNLGSQSMGKAQFQLKQDPGGIVDIEFMVQYLVLSHSHTHPDLLNWTDNVRLLEALNKRSILESTECDALTQAYIAYRSWAHRRALQNQKLLFEPHELDQAGLKTHIDTVSKLWGKIMTA
jgi:glutamate-ammonia-ligase adenylyltransferase